MAAAASRAATERGSASLEGHPGFRGRSLAWTSFTRSFACGCRGPIAWCPRWQLDLPEVQGAVSNARADLFPPLDASGDAWVSYACASVAPIDTNQPLGFLWREMIFGIPTALHSFWRQLHGIKAVWIAMQLARRDVSAGQLGASNQTAAFMPRRDV